MVADREVPRGPVHEGDVGLLVVRHGAVAAHHVEGDAGDGRVVRGVVRDHEAIHETAVDLLVDRPPAVRRVEEAVRGVAEDGHALPVRIEVREVVRRDLDVREPGVHRALEVVVEGAVLVHQHDDGVDGDVLPHGERRALRLGG